jgi:SAM-dependent methyltransferase
MERGNKIETPLRHFQSSNDIYTVDEVHPNWKRWSESRRTSMIRGELVVRLLAPRANVTGVRVLEIGCGDGGTSIAFARRNCTVFATDADPKRVNTVKAVLADFPDAAPLIHPMVVMGEELPFEDRSMDIVILQGVLEHTQLPQLVMDEVSRVLVPGGHAFLTVPNRFALFNLIADPHWGLPLIGFFNRPVVSFLITKILRREAIRPDFAELLSLPRMKAILRHASMTGVFVNREAAREMFRVPEAVVWTAFERRLVRLVASIKLDRVVVPCVPNGWNASNFFLIPTWYLIAEKSAS